MFTRRNLLKSTIGAALAPLFIGRGRERLPAKTRWPRIQNLYDMVAFKRPIEVRISIVKSTPGYAEVLWSEWHLLTHYQVRDSKLYMQLPRMEFKNMRAGTWHGHLYQVRFADDRQLLLEDYLSVTPNRLSISSEADTVQMNDVHFDAPAIFRGVF